MWKLWQHRRLDARLSAALDGELAPAEKAALDEQLLFDQGRRRRLDSLAQVSELTAAALEPAQRPDPVAAARRLTQKLAGGTPDAAPPTAAVDLLKMAGLTVAGLTLLGLTVAGLRRRRAGR